MPVWTTQRIGFLKTHRHKLSEQGLADALNLSLTQVKNKLEDLDVDEEAARRRARDSLYSDFQRFYLAHRCPWSPPDPIRLYTLCRKTLYREYGKWMSPQDVLWKAKELLVGMFDNYDPSRYRGKLRQEDNFVHLFMQRMRGRLGRLIRPTTDRGNRGRADKFPHRPELGLVNQRLARGKDWCDELVETLPDALMRLEGDEYQTIIKKYHEDKSFAEIGRDLGISDKTAKSRHDEALTKLRRYYDVNAD